MVDTAQQIAKAFGGVPALRRALNEAGYPRSLSAIYRWDLPREKGGTNGHVPTSAQEAVRIAGSRLGLDVGPILAGRVAFMNGHELDLRELPLNSSAVLQRTLEHILRAGMWGKNLWALFYSDVHAQQQLLSLLRKYDDDMGGASTLAGISSAVRWFRLYQALQKVPAIANYVLGRLEKPETRVVVFAIQPEIVVELTHRLARAGAARLFVNSAPHMEARHIEKFRASAGRVLVSPPKVGPPLDFASEVVFADASWRAADNSAAAMRVHRKGTPLRVRFATLSETIDKDIQRVLREGFRAAVSL